MQSKRGELVPAAEALADLPGPVKAIRPSSPQALRPFTQVDQVNALVTAREADPDLGFMARRMVLCSLPRSNPGKTVELSQGRRRDFQEGAPGEIRAIEKAAGATDGVRATRK